MRIYQKHAQTLCKIAFHTFHDLRILPGLRGWDAAVNSLAVNLALEERWYYAGAKLLQKSEMRKDIVIELSYKGFG